MAWASEDPHAHALALNIDARPEIPYGLRTAALFDAVQGRLAEASTHLRELQAQLRAGPLQASAFGTAAAIAQLRLIDGDTLGAVREIEEFLKGQSLDSIGASGQPALHIARFFARANQPRRAAAFLNAYEVFLPPALAKMDLWLHRQARGELALANHDAARALTAFRPRHLNVLANAWFEDPLIPLDSRPELARAWEQAGQPDSAIAVFERYVSARALFRAELDAFELAAAFEHLATLYENRNDFTRAEEYHRKLAHLWREADPQLRQRAAAALRRAAALDAGGSPGKRSQ
jgi:hypothetical protein